MASPEWQRPPSANGDDGLFDDDDDQSTSESGHEDEEPPSDQDDDDLTLPVYQEKFRAMQEQLRNLGPDPSPSDRDDFVARFRKWLQPQPETKDFVIDQWNFLYKLAQDGPDVPWLVKRLVKQFPAFLEEQDGDGRSSLLLAINRRQTEFVRAVLDSNLDDALLEKTLKKPSWNRENCIHQAISNNLDPAITISLIEKSSPQTLAAQDQKKLTPLHLAVDYARCTKSRFEVVAALIRCGDGAFDTETDKPDRFSAYLYHLDTKRKYERAQEEKAKKALESGGGSAKSNAIKQPTSESKAKVIKESGASSSRQPKAFPSASSQGTTASSLGKAVQEDDWERVKRNAEDFMPPPPKRAPTANFANFTTSFAVIPPAGAFSQGQKDHLPSPLGPKDARAIAFPGIKERPSTPGSLSVDGKPVETRPKPRRSKQSKVSKSSSTREKPSPEIAERIAKELKLHYLRSIFTPQSTQQVVPAPIIRTRDSAIRFLYGDNKEDKHIYFVFPPTVSTSTQKIDFDDFKSSYDRLVFDQVLLAVEFRHVELNTAVNPRRQNKYVDMGAGRRDMETFFKWLRDKNVTNIIKVIVEDRKGSTAHSDQAIETALKEFDVEILDWRKVDIDPRTIWEATRGNRSNLRELHLWWSGNNALLRSWSELDGLPKLRNLKHIFLHQTQRGLESPERIRKDVEEFKTRLQINRNALSFPPIQVEHEKSADEAKKRPKGLTYNLKTDGRSGIDTHRWLSVMDTFAQGIQMLKAPSGFPDGYLTHDSLPPELSKEVRVALIDDGADFMHRAIKNILDNGRSFDSGFEDFDGIGGPGPFHGSTTGHGTLMAYMIGRVCPKVKIFVCKLDVVRDGPKASFTAKSAADAVEFAVKRGFDIISMSWTVQKSNDEENDNTEDIKRLETAIKSAVDQKRLVFCSAPDIGSTNREVLDTYYPFSCPGVSDSIFKIGAAKADGSMHSWVGAPSSVDFILPGHNVEIREEDKIHEHDDIPKTGSSVATALAAGLAALIIHCVRLGAIYNFYNGKGNDSTVVNKSSVVAIKQFAAMREAFLKISSSGDKDKDRRIEVESFFDGPGKVLNAVYEKGDAKQKWTQITDISRDLISSKAVAKAVATQRH
ncbi:hypothetical protein QBC43DRAFT_319804 [Cladorrhinum sp. PSN259]|nr:hypothetical protein QBC43DRAFT_319804 [Cladorrhinum sp. PSN259]